MTSRPHPTRPPNASSSTSSRPASGTSRRPASWSTSSPTAASASASPSLLAYQLERIQVFRFPPEEYARFRQIVLFGTRKPKPCREDQVLGMLRAIHTGTLVPPDLPASLDPPYPIPVSSRVPHLLFQNLGLDPEDLVHEIDQYGVYAATFHRLHPDSDAQRLRPLMPLRRGHLALVLASGHLNNELVTDRRGTRLLVKGRDREGRHSGPRNTPTTGAPSSPSATC